MRSLRILALAAFALTVAPPRAAATDGHLLHGVGAVNSSLGGIGVASNASLLGSFYVNPAGLASFEGTNMEMGFELLYADRSVGSSVGAMSGSTTSAADWTPIPAFGFSTRLANGVVIGLSGLGIGGFGVNYASDPTNPILAPSPNGFGHVYSNFQLLKISPAVAWSMSPKLRVGIAANINWQSLAVNPMPVATPDFDPGVDGVPGTADDRAYYPSAAAADAVFGFGFQVGMQYDVSEKVSVGASYTSPQVFSDFEFTSTSANPNLPSFGSPRTFEFRMDVPAIYAVGVALNPTSKLHLGADVKYIAYGSTEGFEKRGYNPDFSVQGFGWDDITVVSLGGQYRLGAKMTLRAGYHYTGNPISDAQSMFNIPAPAVVQQHLTGGFGYTIVPGVDINVAAYQAFENSITGPIYRPTALPGTSVTNTLSETSILVGFTFSPRR